MNGPGEPLENGEHRQRVALVVEEPARSGVAWLPPVDSLATSSWHFHDNLVHRLEPLPLAFGCLGERSRQFAEVTSRTVLVSRLDQDHVLSIFARGEVQGCLQVQQRAM